MASSPHFAKIKDPLQTNLHICKLSGTIGSANRMEAVCKSIPNNFTGTDLEAIDYHWACYQIHKKNQDRLQCNMVASSASHSPRKHPSSSGSHLFPAECIFCQKLEKNVSGKTERCAKFSVLKEKDGAFREPSWTPIASQSLAMGRGHLHRLVQGEDLFAREAQYQPSCHNAFKLQYVSHCGRIRAEAARCECDTEQQRKVAAHLKVFNIVLDFIQQRVVEQNEVVELSSLRLLYIQEFESTDFPNQITEVRCWRIDYRILRYTNSLHLLRSIQATRDVFPLILYITPVSLSQMQWPMHISLDLRTSMRIWLFSYVVWYSKYSMSPDYFFGPLPLKILRYTHWMMSFQLTWLNS